MGDKALEAGTVKVSVADIRADMVLAANVIAENGQVLLANGAMLNNFNYTKLYVNNISHVIVKGTSIDADKPALRYKPNTIKNQKNPLASRPEYQGFFAAYEEKTEEIKHSLIAISNGAAIDLYELSRLTGDVIAKLQCKSDIFSLVGFIRGASEHTYTHSNNVSLLCHLFSRWMGMRQDEGIVLTAAGVLHDIGKMKTPPEILNKRGRLTDEEFIEMKRHVMHGYELLEHQNIPNEVKLAALMHHEKIDGKGYMLGLKGEQIDKLTKIISICDIYDAMTANRVYRGKICPFDVIRTFERSVYGELDTECLLIFLRNIAYSFIGAWTKLNDGRAAEVMFINAGNLSRPIVRTESKELIDLSGSSDISIVEVI
ncbi:MAG: HD-GYP domain-containing protein [Clostridiales bacterium]|jgi:putative nucleotidyltransferase with HDIG domain|nr:HD-GYP domain-containing protein [Clostridiales bacterium]